MASEDEATYTPKDAIARGIESALIMGAAGLTVSAIRTSLVKENIGALGVLTRGGGIISIFAASGAAFGFGKAAAANLREKDDSWNFAIGGFFAGAILGLRHRNMPAVLGFGGGSAIVQYVFDYGGGKFSGYDRDPNVDEFESKEAVRLHRRDPIELTLQQLGEGRGIYGPGYRERRADRIKAAYGIDVPRT